MLDLANHSVISRCHSVRLYRYRVPHPRGAEHDAVQLTRLARATLIAARVHADATHSVRYTGSHCVATNMPRKCQILARTRIRILTSWHDGHSPIAWPTMCKDSVIRYNSLALLERFAPIAVKTLPRYYHDSRRIAACGCVGGTGRVCNDLLVLLAEVVP